MKGNGNSALPGAGAPGIRSEAGSEARSGRHSLGSPDREAPVNALATTDGGARGSHVAPAPKNGARLRPAIARTGDGKGPQAQEATLAQSADHLPAQALPPRQVRNERGNSSKGWPDGTRATPSPSIEPRSQSRAHSSRAGGETGVADVPASGVESPAFTPSLPDLRVLLHAMEHSTGFVTADDVVPDGQARWHRIRSRLVAEVSRE